jgi:hypothetical protein
MSRLLLPFLKFRVDNLVGAVEANEAGNRDRQR